MSSRRVVVHLLPLALLFPACDVARSEEAHTDETLNTCVQERVTITQGVYGQMFRGCDTPSCALAFADREVRVYDQDPRPPDRQPTGGYSDSGTSLQPTLRITATTVGEGFFELSLPVGTHYLCAAVCEPVTIAAGQLLRLDCCSAPGGHWWPGYECVLP
ncbi:MAG: hypothetical protein V1755_14810 [Chloroflexota bacterium]